MSETRVTYTLNKAVAVINGRADAILRARFDMTYSQFVFLMRLGDDQRSQAEMAALLDVSPAAVSKRVGWFVDRGLVTTSHNRGNARKVMLSLTARGRMQVRRAADELEAAFITAFEGIDGVDLDALNTTLATVITHLTDRPE